MLAGRRLAKASLRRCGGIAAARDAWRPQRGDDVEDVVGQSRLGLRPIGVSGAGV